MEAARAPSPCGRRNGAVHERGSTIAHLLIVLGVVGLALGVALWADRAVIGVSALLLAPIAVYAAWRDPCQLARLLFGGALLISVGAIVVALSDAHHAPTAWRVARIAFVVALPLLAAGWWLRRLHEGVPDVIAQAGLAGQAFELHGVEFAAPAAARVTQGEDAFVRIYVQNCFASERTVWVELQTTYFQGSSLQAPRVWKAVLPPAAAGFVEVPIRAVGMPPAPLRLLIMPGVAGWWGRRIRGSRGLGVHPLKIVLLVLLAAVMPVAPSRKDMAVVLVEVEMKSAAPDADAQVDGLPPPRWRPLWPRPGQHADDVRAATRNGEA